MLKNIIKATTSTQNLFFLLSFVIVIVIFFSQAQNILLRLIEKFLLRILNNFYLSGMQFLLRFHQSFINVHCIYLHVLTPNVTHGILNLTTLSKTSQKSTKRNFIGQVLQNPSSETQVSKSRKQNNGR